jgi:deoxycytidine triphosphate deaminase
LQQGVIRIEPFAESQLRSASIDFTLDRQAMTLSGESIDLGGKHGFRLESGRAVKVYTRERIELPPNYLGRAGAAERLAVSGVVAMHALQIDPGFRGRLHFCLFNASEREFPMRPGDPVLCVEIMPLAVAPAASRVGKHLSTRRRRAK